MAHAFLEGSGEGAHVGEAEVGGDLADMTDSWRLSLSLLFGASGIVAQVRIELG
jgi:hypothetical protein